ncbi:hypothetical protein [Neisseria lactamica]|uniref:hypothetical protein n=1 Tax=Neisseria lactamica TaxID=486 RepID=UPI001863A7FC|nr:hypothetical protein [Neisseria lactamica]
MDAEGAGTGFFAADGNVALAAADIDVAAGFQAALPALAVVLVLFLAGGFKAEAGFDGQEDGALLAGLVFDGVGHFADGIGQLVGLGAGGQTLQGAGTVVGFAYSFSAKAKTKLPNLLRSLGRESLTKKLIINEISLNRSPLTSPTASYR